MSGTMPKMRLIRFKLWGRSHRLISVLTLLRVFRAVTGTTPHQFILHRRLDRAACMLRLTGEPIGDIALDAGFNVLSSFNRRFRRVTGMTPGMWRRQAKG